MRERVHAPWLQFLARLNLWLPTAPGTIVVVLFALGMLGFPWLSKALLEGVENEAFWLVHVAAIPALALRWRVRGVVAGMVASGLVLLVVEVGPLRDRVHAGPVSWGTILSTLILVLGLAALVGWTTLQLLHSEDLRRAAEQAREQLRLAERRYRSLVEHLPATVYIDAIDDASTSIYTSPQIEALTGYAPDEWRADPWLWASSLHPDDREQVLAEHLRTNLTREPFAMEYRLFARDGRVVWVREEGLLIEGSGDEPDRWQGIMLDITAAKEAEAALRASEARLQAAERLYRTLVEEIPAAVYRSAPDAVMGAIYLSPRIEDLTGLTAEEWLADDGQWIERMHPDDRTVVVAQHERAVDTGERISVEYRLRTRDERWVWVRDEAVLVRDDAGTPLYWHGVLLDVTERKRVEQALEISEERFRGAFENATVGMSLSTPDGRFTRVNRAFCDMLGYTEAELLGRSFEEVTHPGDLPHDVELQRQLLAGEIPAFQSEKRYVRKDGSVVWAILSVALVRDIDGQPLFVIGQAQDITTRKRLEQRLRHQAFHDALTGLPNRALFMDRLEHALARAARHDELVAVLFLDLDGFKAVNDTFGHGAGDELLVAVAQRLTGWVRASDTVARLGGDEFTVLLEDAPTLSEVRQVAERIVSGMAEPFGLGGREIAVRTSVGIATNATPGIEPAELLRNADVALYRAKAAEGGCYVEFDASAAPALAELAGLRAGY